VERALRYEEARQFHVLRGGGSIVQETRGWVEGRGVTVSQRTKEQAHDYRYFPEPDLPPLRVDDTLLGRIRADLPELPAARRTRYRGLGLSAYDAAVIVAEPVASTLFDAARRADVDPKALANWVSGAFLGLLRSDPAAADRVDPDELADLVRRVSAGELSGTNAKEVFAAHAADGTTVASIVAARGFRQISDAGALTSVVDEVVAANPKAVEDYRSGKPVIGFFVGQVMKATRGQANATVVQEAVKRRLDADADPRAAEPR